MIQLEPPPLPEMLTDEPARGHEDPFDLADDRAHHHVPGDVVRSLTPHLPSMLLDVDGVPRRLFETHFASTFYDFAGQNPPPEAEIALHGSAAVSIDCTARALRASGVRRVGLVTPTSDTVSGSLRGAGLFLVPLEEARFWEDVDYRDAQLRQCDAVFLIIPNNPTGFEPDRATLLDAVGAAAERGLAVLVDFGLRFYSRLGRWDQYGAIAASWPELDAILLEDTSKTWPVAELDVSISCALGRLREPLRRAIDDDPTDLTDVPRLALRLLASLITIDQIGRDQSGTDPYFLRVVGENRQVLRRLLAKAPVHVEIDSDGSQASVEWLRLPEGPTSAAATCAWLEERGVSVSPGDPLLWDRADGGRHVRVALARTPAQFQLAAAHLASLLQERFPSGAQRRG